MKMKMKILVTICILITLNSCKKTENYGLTGKWRLTETYDGYVMGGSFSWHKVDFINSHTLEFTSDNKYFKKNEANGGFQACSGTYQQLTADTIVINSSCQTIVERTKISKQTNRELILDYPVIEGLIRYKYTAEK